MWRARASTPPCPPSLPGTAALPVLAEEASDLLWENEIGGGGLIRGCQWQAILGQLGVTGWGHQNASHEQRRGSYRQRLCKMPPGGVSPTFLFTAFRQPVRGAEVGDSKLLPLAVRCLGQREKRRGPLFCEAPGSPFGHKSTSGNERKVLGSALPWVLGWVFLEPP